ncbi:Hsp70 family protein [Roseiconus nitratireducens]|uniref:Hsp70 family protein n=1 Tax=Roseiconus nitratireducens TaxID=2605748 RepID=A0A5M6CYG0_9BACT|nr:Hsp70 family protein [Roseiconus nitratireducens]KAA5540254.1 Hsp70 family protein [Roseiconus nitratireducens]
MSESAPRPRLPHDESSSESLVSDLGLSSSDSCVPDLPPDPPTCEVGSSDSQVDSLDLNSPSLQEPGDGPGSGIPTRIGEYRVKNLIGSGGMGQVYLAEHIRMQRQVALKVLRSDRMSDDASVERFYDEVRAASRVLHPNVVTAFDAGEFEGIHFLVMEYVDGVTLTRLVAKNGPLSPGMAASIIRQAALGLLHAHRAGIVHRDVKPGNIIQAKDGTIKVLDLGLAQISNVLWSDDGRELGRIQDPDSRHKRKGKLIGTLSYMSPEQLESPDDADPRSDIYALGAVLFFLLTGRPPFQGEYLDQVYGHRHGEIPDLMQFRGDVDWGMANILRRMMAKRLSERYASLDEVIDDLRPYVEDAQAPTWLSEYVSRQAPVDVSTMSGGSTAITNLPLVGIDLGMTYAAVAESISGVGIRNMPAGEDGQPLFRMAIATDEGHLQFDTAANQMRLTRPRQVAHCLPMYIGKDFVQREVGGRKCPPEVLLAIAIRKVVANAWPDRPIPKLAAIAVPSSYDQFHRRSIKQAARIAGIDSMRLVDRSVAAVQSLLLENDSASLDDHDAVDLADSDTVLFLGLTGQASEVALIRRESMQLTQLATDGHWHTGMLAWQQRLVELAASGFRSAYRFDPSKSSLVASRLQVSCERALKSLLLLPQVTITIDRDGQPLSIVVCREEWLERCHDLIQGLQRSMQLVCKLANVRPTQIDECVTLGPLLGIPAVRHKLLKHLRRNLHVRQVDRSEVARGAAACLTAELPQRSDMLTPPRCVSSQTIGIVVEGTGGRRKILPIIPRGTILPARTNRKLTIARNRDSMTLSVVESSGVRGDNWHSLGRYEFEVDKGSSNQLKRTRLIGFELNVDGLLSVRAQTPGTPESKRLPIIPASLLQAEGEAEWIRWMSNLTF